MKTILYKASTRGHANHGWLDTYNTFSFVDYHNPSRVHFGKLRVINDDIIIGGEGFGTHPHENMEIISIPLYGTLQHRDSIGNTSVIKSGEVQVMSAGTGITHSEFNADKEKPVNFFQIWVFPDKQDVIPRYQQKMFELTNIRNKLIEIISPDQHGETLWIYQQAWFSMGVFDKGEKIPYKVKREGNGVFAMIVEGEFTFGDQILYHRDGIGISEANVIEFIANTDNARILLIDVPMR